MLIRTKNVAKESARFLRNILEEKLKIKDNVVLGVVGGRSADSVLANLTQEKIDWQRVHIFLVDERKVPLDNPESNFLIVKKHFSKNVHPFKIEEGVEGYARELDKFGGKYDILFLSAGEDGHIGALYPNHHSIEDYSKHFIEMNDSPKLPKERMSASYNLILKAEDAVILFFGKEKKQALKKFDDPMITIQQCPAKLVQELDRYFVITDLK